MEESCFVAKRVIRHIRILLGDFFTLSVAEQTLLLEPVMVVLVLMWLQLQFVVNLYSSNRNVYFDKAAGLPAAFFCFD